MFHICEKGYERRYIYCVSSIQKLEEISKRRKQQKRKKEKQQQQQQKSQVLTAS